MFRLPPNEGSMHTPPSLTGQPYTKVRGVAYA